MRNVRAAFAVAVLPLAVHAGGDVAIGYITDFAGSDGNYVFRFNQEDAKYRIFPGCPILDVHVRYENHWFGDHPTRDETKAAAAALERAHKQGKPVMFGYMGNGLTRAGKGCSFETQGLKLEDDPSAVMAYHGAA